MRTLVGLTFVLALMAISGAAAEPVASPDWRLTVEHREGARKGVVLDEDRTDRLSTEHLGRAAADARG